MPSRIAIIPARGGSKRIPKKNIIDFFGQPMISLTIKAAIDSGCFDRVLVSTDCEEIAEVARIAGAEVPFLRVDHSDDYSPVSEATLVALNQAEEFWKESYDLVVQLMANCPIRTASDIKNSITAFDKKAAKFQISSFKFGWMNPWWAAKVDHTGVPEPMFSEAMTKRSQDLDDLYCPTGAIWIADVPALKESRTFYGQGYVYEALPWTSAVDIDDTEDLDLARSVYLMLRES